MSFSADYLAGIGEDRRIVRMTDPLVRPLVYHAQYGKKLSGYEHIQGCVHDFSA